MNEDSEILMERARLGFVAAAVLAGLTAIFAMFGPHGSSMAAVERGLKAKVESALAAEGFAAVDVAMRGQRAVLSGAGGVEGATQAALRAAGPGGKWAGGVTSVDASDVSDGPAVSPYVWSASRRGGSVAMTGYVPSRAVKEQLAAAARQAFPNGDVTDETRVAPGAPRAWAGVARNALRELGRLSRGEARLVDQNLVLIGDGPADVVPAVRNFFSRAMPTGYQARLEINVTGQGIGIPELSDIDLTDANPQRCQAGFARLLQNNVINFETNSAAIDASSARLLDNLISVAVRCDRNRIEIAGHTDSSGDATANMALSRQRAEAVRSYLVDRGVAADRVRAVGYGADRPRQSNATRAGQAANRRIEFTVEG